jgi:hypothetical protein
MTTTRIGIVGHRMNSYCVVRGIVSNQDEKTEDNP